MNPVLNGAAYGALFGTAISLFRTENKSWEKHDSTRFAFMGTVLGYFSQCHPVFMATAVATSIYARFENKTVGADLKAYAITILSVGIIVASAVALHNRFPDLFKA